LEERWVHLSSGLEVIPAQPLVAIHGDVLCWLVAVYFEIVTVRESRARPRPLPLLVDVYVPTAHLEALRIGWARKLFLVVLEFARVIGI
jgi:hypothetical protein